MRGKRIMRKAASMLLALAFTLMFVFAQPTGALAADRLYTYAYFNGTPTVPAVNAVDNTASAAHLDVISPNGLSLVDDGSGTLMVQGMTDGYVDKMHQRGLKVVPFLSNHWSKPNGNEALINYDVLAQQVADAVQANNFDGINIDIENANQTSREAFSEFVRLVRERVPADKEVCVAVAANPSNWQYGWHGQYDYQKLGQYADYLIIMAYDQHTTSAGPVAGYDWVERSIKYALQYVPKEKLLLAMPFYGRVWKDDGSYRAALTADTIPAFNSKVNANVYFDISQKAPVAKFTIPEGNTSIKIGSTMLAAGSYTMWFEDNLSLQHKYLLAKQYGLKGTAFWALAGSPANFWSNYGQWQQGNHSAVGSSGWQQDGAGKMFHNNGYPVKGWQFIDGNFYYFDERGYMRSNCWMNTDAWYYLDESGKMVTGWKSIDNEWYYFNQEGRMRTGWEKVGTKWYLLAGSGAMATGWQPSGGKWYLLGSGGAMLTGWQKDGDKWYFIGSGGDMKTGWQRSGSKWYLMANSGEMRTGWAASGGRWYLLGGGGDMLTNWQKEGGAWYYLKDGAMLTGTHRIGGTTYTFNGSGQWIQ